MVKWIGYHIWDFITRFRNDVYIEDLDVSSETNAVVVDSSGKLTKNPSLGGGSSVTSVTGTTPVVSSGGTTPDISVTTGAVVNGGDNLATQDQIYDFVTGQGYTSNIGDITRATVIADTGSVDTTSGDFSVTIIGGEGIGTSVVGNDLTVSAEDATESVKGVVELATTVEADAGTDTVRAVTPEGLKSHVDTRYTYSYITWSSSGKPIRDGSNNSAWLLPNINRGVYDYNWTTDTGITSTTTGTTTYQLSKYHASNSITIPHAGILVGFKGVGRNHNGNRTFKVGLFHADNGLGGAGADGNAGEGIDFGNPNAVHEFTLRCVATADASEASGGTDGTANSSFAGPCILDSNTANLQLQAGDVVIPALMGNSTNDTDRIHATITIILKIPLA